MPYILSAENIGEAKIEKLGGKALHLAEMISQDFPVPKAFFITTDAYDKFANSNNLRTRIMNIINNTTFTDVDSLKKSSDQINELIINSPIPNELREAIIKSYMTLEIDEDVMKTSAYQYIKAGRDKPFVAVRSSGVSEDIKSASSAGQYETFLNVRGEENLILSVKKCWASLYTPRVIYYRNKNNQPQDSSICVVIQKMINSESAGVAFTIDPTKPVEGSNNIIIEACWGLGETLVQGQVDPDHYVVDKTTGELLSKRISTKNMMRIRNRDTGATMMVNVPDEIKNEQVLSDDLIVKLAAYSKKIEEFYGHPQDIEWATERNRLYILQTRDVTTLEQKESIEVSGNILISGYGASPGLASGKVKIVRDISELNKILKGDIMVTTMTSPDMVPAMEKSAAIVTNEGGTTCHAAIVSRELGIPCIVGTKTATDILKENTTVTVDASHGNVYEGDLIKSLKPAEVAKEESFTPTGEITATDIKVNLAFPQTATSEIASRVDGVGLLRLEHMLTKSGTHPMELIRQNRENELTHVIADGVGQVAKIFYPKPIWVRTTDLRTDEYRNMAGGENEPKEANPMLGWHGIRRSLDETKIIKAEFAAFKKLYDQGFDNIGIMIPFTYDVSEFLKAKAIAAEIGLPANVKIGIMVEVPSAALSIEEYCKHGIDFISFGSNDLTQLTLGIDRNNETLIKLFDEMHPGMKFLFRHVIDTCKKYNVKTSICGEAPSNSKEAVEFLIRSGIDSLSVNIDAIDKVRSWVVRIERKILLEKLKS